MSGIYIHIPFCKQACYYCDFHFSTSVKRKDEMLEAIHEELYLRQGEVKDVVKTIYFGGGTPSLLTCEEINDITNLIRKLFDVDSHAEVTLEANPDDLTDEKIEALAVSDINRLSIGIQSFFDRDLVYMNRAHNADESERSLAFASRFFDNISIDLIYGIPGLSASDWDFNLNKTFDFGVGHISSYALTVESKTALDHFIKTGKYEPLDEGLAQEHFKMLQKRTQKMGYAQYEISNFAKDGMMSKHNMSYWKGVSYLGIGPSAHSFDGRARSWNVANNFKYVQSVKKGILPSEREVLDAQDVINESIMTGLRTTWGFSLEEVGHKFGEKFRNEVYKNAKKYMDRGILKFDDGRLFLEPDSYFLADGISSDLFLLKV